MKLITSAFMIAAFTLANLALLEMIKISSAYAASYSRSKTPSRKKSSKKRTAKTILSNNSSKKISKKPTLLKRINEKQVQIHELIGLARYHYLQELRSPQCLKKELCPLAYIVNEQGVKSMKLVFPKMDGNGTEVRLYTSEGSLSSRKTFSTARTSTNLNK